MTTRELIQWLGQKPLVLAGLCVLLPVLAWLCGRLHARGGGGQAPWKFFYSILVYLACVPGMFAAVLRHGAESGRAKKGWQGARPPYCWPPT